MSIREKTTTTTIYVNIGKSIPIHALPLPSWSATNLIELGSVYNPLLPSGNLQNKGQILGINTI